MRGHVADRHRQVLEVLRDRGSVRVSELAAELGISPVTLRRDVEVLAAEGRLRRLHGSVQHVDGTAVTAPATPRAGQRALTVGMVVPTTDYYYADVVQGARAAVQAQGARLVVGLSRYLPDEDAVQAGQLVRSGVDGLLVTPWWRTGAPVGDEGSWVARLPVPTVLVERTAPAGHPAAGLDRVRTDHAQGAAQALAHLARLGHRRIALALQSSPTAHRMADGCASAAGPLGLESLPPLEHRPQESRTERLDRTLRHLLDALHEHGATAALVHTDADAATLVPRLQHTGVRVPEDLAVVAYDDELAGLTDLPLTSMALPKRALGTRAAELLLARVAATASGADLPVQHVDLLPRLSVRASCGASARAF
ncbi:substrate-binding domain-containing protein [Streptomyces sp. NPDC001941]|uniref:substrate-binding domain-containing protein n=1 Tax=Streptomyces sp. NPDC001941 TaxID=3154659 RepID=UPI0033252236